LRVILGIGNPGNKYANTKHNIGFTILDRFAVSHQLHFKPSKYDFYYAKGAIGTFPFLLVKPTTYVNNSGIAAKNAIDINQIEVEDFLVISDDINLLKGDVRVRKVGGDGGHNGIASIIYYLNNDQFPRIRFGIGNDFETGKMANYVLSKFNEKEIEDIKPSIEFSTELIHNFIVGGSKQMLDFYSKNKSLYTLNQNKDNL